MGRGPREQPSDVAPSGARDQARNAPDSANPTSTLESPSVSVATPRIASGDALTLEPVQASQRSRDLANSATLLADSAFELGGTLPIPQRELKISSIPPAANVDDPLTQETPGRYEFRRELGSGGIGRVDVVWDHHLKREVALKQLREALREAASVSSGSLRNPIALRFVNEARIAGVLEHPGIVAVHELGRREDGSLYYTMQLVKGRTLAAALEGMTLRERLALLPNLIELCQAVAYAHEKCVIHRDLKPENVMLGDFGETIILDFGLAKLKGTKDIQGLQLSEALERIKEAGSRETVAGVPLGTPAYMPPEQARGDLDQIDERSDVYALGAILFELLTGRPPYEGRSALDIVKRVLSGDAVADPRRLEPACPAELAAIALTCLQHDPAKRYASAKSLAADLQAFLTGGLVGAHRYQMVELVQRFVQRQRWRLLVASLLLLVGVGAWNYSSYLQREAVRQLRLEAKARTRSRAREILANAGARRLQPRWLDTFAYQLIGLRAPVVLEELKSALADPNPNVRRLAARALAGFGGKDAVDALVARLSPGAEGEEAVAIEIVQSLGILADPRSDRAVFELRRRWGSTSHAFKATEQAYRMIPLPTVPPGQALSAEDWKLRGDALMNKGDDDATMRLALAAFDRALALDPRNWRALNNRGLVRRQLNDEAGAIDDYTRALKLHFDTAALLNRAQIYRNQERFAHALADLNQVMESPNPPKMVLRERSRLRVILKDYVGAEADARAAIAQSPKHAVSRARLAEVMYAQNLFDAALAAYNEALELDDKYSYARVARAEIYLDLKETALARPELDAVLTQDPNHALANVFQARLEFATGDDEQAIRRLDTFLQDGKSSSFVFASRGELWLRKGNLAKAKGDFEAAVRSAAAREKFEYQLALLEAELRLNGLEAARKLREALEPSSPAHSGAPTTSQRALQLLLGTESFANAKPHWVDRGDLCIFAHSAALAAELDGKPEQAAQYYAAAQEAKRASAFACRITELALARVEATWRSPQ